MTINEKVLKQKAKITKANDKIRSLQEECEHIGVHVEYGANTGNWCTQDNSYWIDWKCPHCEKRWTTPQDRVAYSMEKTLQAVKQ